MDYDDIDDKSPVEREEPTDEDQDEPSPEMKGIMQKADSADLEGFREGTLGGSPYG